MRLRECAQNHRPLDYGQDLDDWRRALRERFPELKQALDKRGEADFMFEVLNERMAPDPGALCLRRYRGTEERV